MRSYIFTDSEVRRLRRWLETGEEDDTTRQIFVQIRRNMNGLERQLELLTAVARELRLQGRIQGRARFPRGFGSRLRRVGSASIRRGRGRDTSGGLRGC